VTRHHRLPFSQARSRHSEALRIPSTAPQTLPPAPRLHTCTGCGSSGTDTGTGTGMSSFNHGGFFRCKLLVLSCRASDIVPRLSSGLGEGRSHSWEGSRLIPDTVHACRAEQSALLQAVTDGAQAPSRMTSQAPREGSGITARTRHPENRAHFSGPQDLQPGARDCSHKPESQLPLRFLLRLL